MVYNLRPRYEKGALYILYRLCIGRPLTGDKAVSRMESRHADTRFTARGAFMVLHKGRAFL